MTISIPDMLTVDHSENYIVSIRLRSGGLSFSGYIPSAGERFFYKEAEFDRSVSYVSSLKEFFFAHEFLSWVYKRVNVVCAFSRYTLVPDSFFAEEGKERFLTLNFSAPESRSLVNPLDGLRTKLVFGLEEDIYEFCSRSLLHPAFVHPMAPLLTLWRRQSLTSLCRQMFVVVERKRMDIACYSQGQLLFANAFQVDQVNDALYYILYVWQQVGLDRQRDQLCFFIEPLSRISLANGLRTYLQNIQPMEIPSDAYLQGSEVARAPMDLISLLLCE